VENYSSAQTFLAFIGEYSVFAAPIAGILASDYWLVKKQNIDVPALYNPNGRYSYWHGWNWRAFLAFIVAVAPNLPGLAYLIGLNADGFDGVKISNGAKNLYTFDWLFGFVTSVVIYTTMSLIFPSVTETVYGHEIEGSGSDDIEGAHRHHEKDSGTMDAADIGTDFHTHQHEKHMHQKKTGLMG
jgi:NCS1 family nucleobase:cation symporter-1